PGMVNMDLVEEANTTKHQQVEKHLTSYQQQAAVKGVSVELKCYAATGSVGSQICQIAEDLNVDLIVLGRKGHNAITEALLGSVSNHVMHHAPCAVLIIQ
ncbi:MAG: universal stress protein, partial [Cyanobacteria bacterium P01_A01_bin.68]